MSFMRGQALSICTVLLKYNSPANFSHFAAFAQKAQVDGHHISYILSEGYKWVVDDFKDSIEVDYLGRSADVKTMMIDFLKFHTTDRVRIRNILQERSPDILFLGDLHPAHSEVVNAARKTGCRNIWWWVHEPYRENKKKYGWWRQHYYAFAESFQPRLLKKVDLVVLSSQKALSSFTTRYPWFEGKVVQVPLIFPDYYEASLDVDPQYVTFVGNAYPAKGVDIFFKLVEYAANKRPDIEFQIVTATHIRHYLTSLSASAQKRLKVINRERISDAELGRAVRQSLVILTPYRQSTQSGVVPVAFMHGTPVISTNVGGMPELVQPRKTGILLSLNAPLNDWLKSIDAIKASRQSLGRTCRRYYEKHYSPDNWLKIFPKLFHNVKRSD